MDATRPALREQEGHALEAQFEAAKDHCLQAQAADLGAQAEEAAAATPWTPPARRSGRKPERGGGEALAAALAAQKGEVGAAAAVPS